MDDLNLDMWDVIVIGGGPAGSTVARKLALAEKKVLLLDASIFPRVKLCAGWITKQALSDLELSPSDYPLTIQPFSSIFIDCDGKSYETSWDEPASYGIIRYEFDHFLLKRAEKTGVDVRCGIRVREVKFHENSVTVYSDKESFKSSIVVGAGGHTCPVARSCGSISSEESVVLTQESETKIGSDVLQSIAPNYGLPELFPEADFNGYAWYFTKGDYLNIGVGCVGKEPSVHERLHRFLKTLHNTGRLSADAVLNKFKGHAYSIYRTFSRNIAGDRFLLVGDAAGLAQDFSGEGIGPAIKSSIIASANILDFLDSGKNLDNYKDRICALYGNGEVSLGGKVIEFLPTNITKSIAKLMCKNAWLRRRFVLEGAFGIG
ncbi:MAG: NAD(P)/FAD-dependent oxidoreductase [Nitrospinota bacterium]|nr:NAD(P)/FAD-dependent oxidoreductase [Nitrospinota bacterium]